jgi:hypothetical protein
MRGTQREGTVRAMLVVMPDVAVEHSAEVPFVHDEEMVGALRSHGPYPPFGDGVGIWRPDGAPDDACPSPSHSASKPGPNVVSRSRSRYLTAMPASRKSAVMLRAHWVTQSLPGLAVMPERKTRRYPWWMKNST